MQSDRNGDWLDEHGCCKVCDGEIPYGHTENCDIYKLEQRISAFDPVYAAFSIGFEVRNPQTLLVNVQNALRRSECLDIIEREFFTKHVPDDDGEDSEECAMSWGAEAAEYLEQFRTAMADVGKESNKP